LITPWGGGHLLLVGCRWRSAGQRGGGGGRGARAFAQTVHGHCAGQAAAGSTAPGKLLGAGGTGWARAPPQPTRTS